MDTLQDAVNTQPITIKAGHISTNPHTFRHVLPIHGQTQIKLISPKQKLISFSFLLLPFRFFSGYNYSKFSRSSGFHSLLCVQEGATATFPIQFVQQILFLRCINACLVLNYHGPFFLFFSMLSRGDHAQQISFYMTMKYYLNLLLLFYLINSLPSLLVHTVLLVRPKS